MEDRNLLLLGGGLVAVLVLVFGILVFQFIIFGGTHPTPEELVCCILVQGEMGEDKYIDYTWSGEWKFERGLDSWLPHGYGILKTMYASYEGLYVNGMLEGRGNSHHKVDERECTNEYVNGKRHGQGNCIADDGREWSGEWKDDGVFPHNGVMSDASGKIILEWKNGEEIRK